MSNRTGTSKLNPVVTAVPAEGICPARKVTTPVVAAGEGRTRRDLAIGNRDAHAAAHGLGDRARIRRKRAAVCFHQLERRSRAIADADHLIERRDDIPRGRRTAIQPVAPAKAVKPTAPFLEEGDHRLQGIQRLDAVAGVVAPPRLRPARIARLAAGTEADDVGAPLRPAARRRAETGLRESWSWRNLSRHCERSEAIQNKTTRAGLLRRFQDGATRRLPAPRNDELGRILPRDSAAPSPPRERSGR